MLWLDQPSQRHVAFGRTTFAEFDRSSYPKTETDRQLWKQSKAIVSKLKMINPKSPRTKITSGNQRSADRHQILPSLANCIAVGNTISGPIFHRARHWYRTSLRTNWLHSIATRTQIESIIDPQTFACNSTHLNLHFVPNWGYRWSKNATPIRNVIVLLDAIF